MPGSVELSADVPLRPSEPGGEFSPCSFQFPHYQSPSSNAVSNFPGGAWGQCRPPLSLCLPAFSWDMYTSHYPFQGRSHQFMDPKWLNPTHKLSHHIFMGMWLMARSVLPNQAVSFPTNPKFPAPAAPCHTPLHSSLQACMFFYAKVGHTVRKLNFSSFPLCFSQENVFLAFHFKISWVPDSDYISSLFDGRNAWIEN